MASGPRRRPVAGAGQAHFPGRGEHPLHGHLVAGQRAGLVGRDHGRAAQRLHGVEALHHCAPGGHPLHPDREYHREDGRQPFRHGSDGQRDPEQQDGDSAGQGVHAVGDRRHRHHHDGDHDHGHSQQPRHDGEIALEGAGFGLRCLQQSRDRAHFRGHAGGCDDGPAGTLHHGRAPVHHVQAVPDGGRRGQRRGVLRHGLALPGQCRFEDPQPAHVHQPAVGTDGVALAELQQVTDDEVGCRYLLEPAVSDDGRARGGEPRECGHRVLGAAFLGQPDGCVQHKDRDDHEGVHRQPLRSFREPGGDGDQHCYQQQGDQRVGELVQRLAPPGRGHPSDQGVRTLAGQPSRGLDTREAGVEISAELLANSRGRGGRRVHAHSPL